MHGQPITITAETTLSDAYALMQTKGIRHLPVLEGEQLVGIVTDRDLRLATSRLSTHPFAPDALVREVASHPVQTAHPLDPVERAAAQMREMKIGCLPVVDGGELVGILTGVDMIDAMLRLIGVHKPSGRLEVRLSDRPGEVARLTALLAERKINIHSILSYPDAEESQRLVLRVSTIDVRAVAKAICDAKFEVLWPPHMSCGGGR